jgi:hypothetical protein
VTSEPALLPCPFCGGNADLILCGGDRVVGDCYIKCQSCEGRMGQEERDGYGATFWPKEEAITAWNTRPCLTTTTKR